MIASVAAVGKEPGGELLYNGIQLPSTWPPKLDKLTLDPMPVPYLDSPPAVIPIDVGRQLFVDDFLVEATTLKRSFHSATYHDGNPVLRPDRPWERDEGRTSMGGLTPCAMPFSDGVWYDPQDHLFKMWYMGGYVYHTCLATSRDGIRWDKPSFDVRPGTNIVNPGVRIEYNNEQQYRYRDSATVWLDHEEKNSWKRFKMSCREPVQRHGAISIFHSPDGIHWHRVGRTGLSGDRSTIFYNPFRKVWVYSMRDYWEPKIEGELRKFRRYREGPDLVSAYDGWNVRTDVGLWFGPDRRDMPLGTDNTAPGIYNFDAVAYESLMLGLVSLNTTISPTKDGRPKINAICLAFSRDGFHFDRSCRGVFIPVSKKQGDWNYGNVQSAGGCCLVVGDKLYFYVSGRAGKTGDYEDVCSTGLATLRRDGFVSMDATEAEGTLTTRPVRFSGRHCFVNADVPKGELRAEILDSDGRVIQPFSRANCIPFKGDSTLVRIRWEGADDLFGLAGKPVRFRFYLKEGDLYAFWVSPDASGASHGYVAGGGPGFTGPTDTVGAAASSAAGSVK